MDKTSPCIFGTTVAISQQYQQKYQQWEKERDSDSCILKQVVSQQWEKENDSDSCMLKQAVFQKWEKENDSFMRSFEKKLKLGSVLEILVNNVMEKITLPLTKESIDTGQTNKSLK